MNLSLSLSCLILLAFTLPSPSSSKCDDPSSSISFTSARSGVRSAIGTPPMLWSTAPESSAQDYADKRAADCKMEPSPVPYGDNMAVGPGNLGPRDAVASWEKERLEFDREEQNCPNYEHDGNYSRLTCEPRFTTKGYHRQIFEIQRCTFVTTNSRDINSR